MINILAMLVALVVSGVSAYFSIIGLTTLFSAAFYPVIIMGAALEVGKLVSTSWLYRNWNTCPWLLKSYLTVAVLVLMFITSMGTFGFLSRAHIEQQLNITTGDADRVAIVESQIESRNKVVLDYDKQLQQIDDALSKITEKGRGESSLQAADKQRKTRNDLVAKKNAELGSIASLKEEVVRLRSTIRKVEAEVGPLKYIAEAIYGGRDTSVVDLDRAVRMVIILLVIVFDPLAVVLLIAANHGMSQTKEFTNIDDRSILVINDNVCGEGNVTERQADKELDDRYDSNSNREQDIHEEGRHHDSGPDDQRSSKRVNRRRNNSGGDDAGGTKQALQDGVRTPDGERVS
jgi:hypothetical protein